MAVSIMSTYLHHLNNPVPPCFASTPFKLPFLTALKKQSGRTRSLSNILVQSVSTDAGNQGSGASTLEKNQIKTTNRRKKPEKPKIGYVEYNELQHYETLLYPLRTEAVIKNLAKENTLVFVVDKRANKKNIRDAFEKMFNVKVKKVNTSINAEDRKKAFIMLPSDVDAGALAKKFKLV